MKVIIAGDYCPRLRGQQLVSSIAYHGGFKEIQTIIKRNDFAIVNFETNISTPDSSPIKKYGPNLKTTVESISFLKYLGFNVVTLANNHFYDYGEKAVDETLRAFDDSKIDHVGGGRNILEAQKVLYLEKGDEILAVINACEHEFSIADKEHGGSNGIDLIDAYHHIQQAKQRADYVLVIVHGGPEHYQLPTTRMQKWYRFFIDAGADAVVNHHQHCFSGMEVYNHKPIYYGLGNFFFDLPNQKERTKWNEGIMVELDFKKNKSVGYQTIPFYQCIDNPDISLEIDIDHFNSKFAELSSIITDSERLKQDEINFYERNRRSTLTCIQPYLSRVGKSAYYRRLLPSLLSRKKKLLLQNLVECESHRDRLLHTIKKGL